MDVDADAANDTRPICPYGKAFVCDCRSNSGEVIQVWSVQDCYRKNAAHWQDYQHPKEIYMNDDIASNVLRKST